MNILNYRKIKDPRIEGIHTINLDSQLVEVPVFRLDYLPPGRCAGYAKRVSERVFDHRFVKGSPEGDAWNLKYFHSSFKVRDINSHIYHGELIPGDLLLIRRNQSSYQNELDLTGFQVEGTHLAAYLGIDDKNELLIAHQVMRWRGISDLRKLIEHGNNVVRIIKPTLN
jgi:hypothetical protein